VVLILGSDTALSVLRRLPMTPDARAQARAIVDGCGYAYEQNVGNVACTDCIAAALHAEAERLARVVKALSADDARRIAYVMSRESDSLFNALAVEALEKYAALAGEGR
jgi:hypothetical protein